MKKDRFKIIMNKTTHRMNLLSKLSSLFVKILIYDGLSSRNLFNDKFITKQHKEAVSNFEISCLAISKILILRNLF